MKDTRPFYYVYRPSNRLGPVVKHSSVDAAQTEAERLATQHPGEAFQILKCVGISQIVNPASTFWMDGEEPSQLAASFNCAAGSFVKAMPDGEDFP